MNIHKPGIFTTLGKSCLRSFFKPTPLWVHFYVTRHCNFSCQYCGARDQKRKDPSFDEACKIILKIKTLGCNSISFMGGEPTLRRDIVEIVEFCSKNNIYTQLPTNGSLLLNPHNNKTLLEALVAAGLGAVNLSVDSVASKFSASGKELPKAGKVLEALLREKERGLILMLNCVISKENIKEVPAMLDFCHGKKVIMAAIFVQNPNPLKSPAENPCLRNLLFSPKDEKEVCDLADYLIDKKKKGYLLTEPIAYYEAVKKWVKSELNWDCDGGKHSLEVDTDGKIGICGYLPYLEKTVFELGKDYFKEISSKRDFYQKTKKCTKTCLPSCMFCSAFYRRHPPVQFLLDKLRYG